MDDRGKRSLRTPRRSRSRSRSPIIHPASPRRSKQREHRVGGEGRGDSEMHERRVDSEQLWHRVNSKQRGHRVISEQRGHRVNSEQRGHRVSSKQGRHRAQPERHDVGEHHGRRDNYQPRERCYKSRVSSRLENHRNCDARPGHRPRSCSPSFTSKDVAKIIESLKSSSTLQPFQPSAHSNKLDNKNILPEFDPSSRNQRMDIWLRKVNECASAYGWDERTTIHFSMQKLQGLAKVWYQSLSTILYTWEEWQEKLLRAFPCEQNYGQSLEDMLRRKTRYNEPIENYFYEKLALINQCDIVGKRAVDCIIHGLSDKTVKSGALALRCSEPDQLLQFLLSNKEFPQPLSPKNKNESSNGIEHKTGTRQTVQNTGFYCYNCKENGHSYIKCTKPLLRCDHCHKIGHRAENCRSKFESLPTRTDTIQNNVHTV